MRNRSVTYILVTNPLHFKNINRVMRRDVFQAIADPVRREIIEILSEEPLNLNAIAEQFDISRPAISRHIKILNECGLVAIEQQGRERFCIIKPDTLAEIANWIDPFRELWEQRLDSFEMYLEQLQSKQNKEENGKDSS
ncbi:ArsR/SmtB family transcription factor [Balneola sp. EhC07]|uniref:ArsR/SmtB family transcription factor n=1 Tax=Balneola sp. EhC07 TaxID=1849360 RepID=UPI001F32E592|nr:metalloregulator ArsR/SmtB family transcription factor [Balneola sp. EhC07]